ncbi:AAA family ATPase [Cyclobacterium jeungdonense]|uniref:AAA family ATPase n=1 Tax=Cyclobacterium jeungdonense TaxID=708087 RepID=A0ABT8CAN8_9BACT|nr:AAA family ATPase [Cyclobacterium jeungdonense]MDN3689432.1 AAA family ATPase [Cyclobacterium jeungdonense]
MLVLVMGLPGSGKSFFAKRLADKSDMVYLNSDQVRIELGLRGRYSKEDRQKVYAAMAAKTNELLKEGKRVLVDATFQRKKNRWEFQELAKKRRRSVACIRIWAEEGLVAKRLATEREESDADFLIYQKLKSDFDPMEGDYLDIRSEDGKIDSMIHKALEYLNLAYEN